MKSMIIAAALCLVAIPAFAQPAQLSATDADNKLVTIALDSTNTPRVDGNPKTYPTIKDFREGSDYSEVCYKGSDKEAKALLASLVAEADGDGDSYADLISIKKTTAGIVVTASITDEGGEREESYAFSKCQ